MSIDRSNPADKKEKNTGSNTLSIEPIDNQSGRNPLSDDYSSFPRFESHENNSDTHLPVMNVINGNEEAERAIAQRIVAELIKYPKDSPKIQYEAGDFSDEFIRAQNWKVEVNISEKNAQAARNAKTIEQVKKAEANEKKRKADVDDGMKVLIEKGLRDADEAKPAFKDMKSKLLLRALQTGVITLKEGEWLKTATKKTGGANEAGVEGGWYFRKHNGVIKSVLVKSDSENASTALQLQRSVLASSDINYYPKYAHLVIHHEKNMAEVLGSDIARMLNPGEEDSFAQVRPVRPVYRPQGQNSDEDIYVASESFYKRSDVHQEFPENANFKDLFQHAYIHCQRLEPNKYPGPVPEKRPKFTPEYVSKAIADGIYYNLERVILTSVLIDDPDTHSGNLGVVDGDDDQDVLGKDGNIMRYPNGDPVKRKKLVRIDFAAAFKKFDGKLHFGSILRYLPLIGPTNHHRDYSRDALITEDLARLLDGLVKDKTVLKKQIHESVDRICLDRSDAAILRFAKHIGVKTVKLEQKRSANDNSNPGNDSDTILVDVKMEDVEKTLCNPLLVKAKKDKLVKELIEGIKDHVFDNLQQRIERANMFAIQIRASLCFTKNSAGDWVCEGENLVKLNKLISDDPDYFNSWINKGKRFHFRGEGQREASRHLSRLLQHIVLVNDEVVKLIKDGTTKQKVEDRILTQVQKSQPLGASLAVPVLRLNKKHIQTDAYYLPLRKRLQYMFHAVFNDDNKKRLQNSSGPLYYIKSLIGFPTEGNVYNYIEFALFMPITTTKNLGKLLLEGIPAGLEVLSSWGADKCNNYLKNKDDKNPQSIVGRVFAHIGSKVFPVLSWGSWLLRLATMRVTSPLRSASQAYAYAAVLFGEDKKENGQNKELTFACKATGTALAGLSLAVSGAVYIAGGIVLAPIALAVAAKIGISSAVHLATSYLFPAILTPQLQIALAAVYVTAAVAVKSGLKAIGSFISGLFKSAPQPQAQAQARRDSVLNLDNIPDSPRLLGSDAEVQRRLLKEGPAEEKGKQRREQTPPVVSVVVNPAKKPTEVGTAGARLSDSKMYAKPRRRSSESDLGRSPTARPTLTPSSSDSQG